MTHLWPEFNLEGNGIGWVAKSFIMISKIHFLCSHWMSARIWFRKILTHTTVRGLRSVVTHLVQPPRQAPRFILSPFICWLGPTIWIEREFCCRIFAILFSSLLIDIIIGTTWHGDRQLPFLRFRRIKGFSIRVFGETLGKIITTRSRDFIILPEECKKNLDRYHLIQSSKYIE